MNSNSPNDKKDLFKGRNQYEVAEMLNSNRDVLETDSRRIAFLPGELQQFEKDLGESSATLYELNTELDKVKARIKELAKPHKKTVARCAQALSEKTYEAEVQLFGIADHNTGTMDFYNIGGEFIYSRPLKSTERQASIHSIKAS